MFYPPIGGRGVDPVGRARAVDAQTAAQQAMQKAEDLKLDIERVLMIAEALWTLMKEEHGYSDDALMKRIETIDLRDGRLDGKVAPEPPKHCPLCGRVRMRKRPVCLYCGERVEMDPFER